MSKLNLTLGLRDQPVFKEGDLVAYVHPEKWQWGGDSGELSLHQRNKNASYLWIVKNHNVGIRKPAYIRAEPTNRLNGDRVLQRYPVISDDF